MKRFGKFALGDRIRLVRMDVDPNSIPVGATGVINEICPLGEQTLLGVSWDNGRAMAVILPIDAIERISEEAK